MMEMWGSPPGYNPYQQQFQPIMALNQVIQQLLAASRAKKAGTAEAVAEERATADKETQMWLQLQQNQRAQEQHEKAMTAPPKQYEWEAKVQALIGQGVPTKEAYQQVFNIKTPEDFGQKLDKIYKESYTRGKGAIEGRTAGAPPKQAPAPPKPNPEALKKEYRTRRRQIEDYYDREMRGTDETYKKESLKRVDESMDPKNEIYPAFAMRLANQKKEALKRLAQEKEAKLKELDAEFAGYFVMGNKPVAESSLPPGFVIDKK